ncbi:MFS transporter, FSR family, fosmidomycin resistance protein [Rhizobiales bacterium GAS188]|nr:MFS transporter, FSR family, fosmidomycin resistance protein [Rhizobiales bacterium GAS188]
MSVQTSMAAEGGTRSAAKGLALGVLLAVSFSHLMNDLVQSLIPAIYPILKSSFDLDFGQIGLITLTFQLTASLLQPVVGIYTDRKPMPHSLAIGMGFSLLGLVLLAIASSFAMLLLSVALVGCGSSVFHPESSRVARMASGGRHGLAQSLFQVGGNAGQALGPPLAALIVLPHGQKSVAWFSVAALIGMIVLFRVGIWYKARRATAGGTGNFALPSPILSSRKLMLSALVLTALMFSKAFYTASFTSYYTFYLIDKFHVSVQESQLYLFLFLGAVAAGALVGGPVGDRLGRKFVIWFSILGVFPFTFALPYANLFWTAVLTVPIGLIMASAFSAILVYAQELVPGRVGTVAGVFFGFAFGLGGLGAAVLGELADHTSIEFVYRICAYLPLIGLLTAFLPYTEPHRPTVKPG